MRAIKATGQIDNQGKLRLDNPLVMRGKKVKVIILVAEENEDIDDNLWLTAMTHNPAFAFLHDKPEDIYKLTAGHPFHD